MINGRDEINDVFSKFFQDITQVRSIICEVSAESIEPLIAVFSDFQLLH